ncbi:MAG: T9SS type A sorting domain-containing protein, partial [Melioribacteraceae bacterium]|nr:T9SS type A sorting domain-containing protein [Melioribacteraceae bacterium]
LYQNYPNPFNPSTTIRFSVAENSNVKIVIFDQVGQEVKVLVDDHFSAGTYQEIWNAQENGNLLSSGIYFYFIKAGNFLQTKKMLLLK